MPHWVKAFLSAAALSCNCAAFADQRPAAPAGGTVPAVDAERAYHDLEMLAGVIGERHAGSAAEDRAVEYIAGQFRGMGLEVSIEPVKVPVWHERRARLWAHGRVVSDFPAKAIVFSGTTPAEGIRGRFVDVGSASPRELAGRDLKGAVVLVKRDVYIDYPDYWLTDRLRPLGVAGMVFYSSPGRSGIPTAYFNFKRALKEATPPSVDISYEDAARLVQMQPQEVGLTVEADVAWRESHSVIAQRRGTSAPEEVVMFSAHDDTAYSSPGATDDGGGVAAVLELARVLGAGPPHARTVRFAAWGGHELGLMGSEQYLRTHADAPGHIVAFVNYDGMGSTLGAIEWTAAGGDDWVRFLKGTQSAIGMDDVGDIGPGGTDATNFASLGVPSVNIGQRYGADQNHTPADNLSTTSAVGLEEGLVFAAAVGARLVDDPHLAFTHRFPPGLLRSVRDYAARWGWGIIPESNAAGASAR